MKGIIRTASYARVSSQRQADEMTIESQIADLRRRIARDELMINAAFEYKDDGCTGSELLRPALERLRDHIAASMIDRLYVHSPDRLARRFAHQAILLEEMTKHGCEVVFLNQEGLPDSPETKMLIQMQGMFAEYEREKILERTRRGRRHSAARGNVSVFSRAPYGYRYIRKTESSGEARWEIDPLESKTVRLIFRLVAEQGYSLGAVCRELKSRDIRTRRDKPDWHCATVRGILLNPAYCGEARYGKERLMPRKPGRRAKRGDPAIPRQAKVAVATPKEDQIMIRVPALVSKSLFEEVGKRMEENRKRQRERQDGPKYLLSGLLICGECGSAYCARRQGGGKRLYYRCIGADKYRRAGSVICDNESVKGERLEERVWNDLCELLRHPDRLQEELNRRQCDAPEADAALAQQQARLKDLRGRLDRMIDAYGSGLIEKGEFESRIVPLREAHDREVAALASQRGELADVVDPAELTEALSHLAARIEQNLAAASNELKRELLTLLIKRIEIHRKEIRIVYKIHPRPFVRGPVNRGQLQHRLSQPDAAPRLLEATPYVLGHNRGQECPRYVLRR